MNTSGPCPSSIAIVGESWGRNEDEHPEHLPFIGPAGYELDRMLLEGGFARSSCFTLNVVNSRPPNDKVEYYFHTKTEAKKLGLEMFFGLYPNELVRNGVVELYNNLNTCKPKLIIALGNTALWALTGGKLRRNDEKGKAPSGILRWRSSMLGPEDGHIFQGNTPPEWNILPTIHPAACLRERGFRSLIVHDLRRASKMLEGFEKPKWSFTIRPKFSEVMECIKFLKEHRRLGKPLACDTEGVSTIDCIGLAWSTTEAICIPLTSVNSLEGYWSSNEEVSIIYALRELLCGPYESPLCFQNAAHDLQVFARQCGYLPRVTDDTMLMQHTLFPGLKKGLDFLSSMYCDYHRYWKDDGKDYSFTLYGEEQFWRYNCEDCIRTLEVYGVLRGLISSFRLDEQYDFQMRLLVPVVKMMLRGVLVDERAKLGMVKHLNDLKLYTEKWINTALGRTFNCRSPIQMTELFYNEMRCRPIKNRTPQGWTLTCDDAALDKIASREPILKPLIHKIKEFRSIGIFKKNYAEMRLPPDKHMRCSINLTGTETYRFSSSEDLEGYGGNLQTLPKGTED